MPRVSKIASETPVVVNVAPQSPAAAVPVADTKTELDPNWFFDKISALSADDWQRVYTLELHRMEPKLPGVPGSKGYLDVFTEPITRAFIKNKYGGGKFRLVLLKNGRYQTCQNFDIEGEPIYLRG